MTTLNKQVGASSDDAKETYLGVVSLNDASVTETNNGDYIGLRFTNVTIPPGATIDSASMQFYFATSKYDNAVDTIYAEDADNPGTFATTNYDVSGRTKTTASTSWSNTSSGSGWEVSPSIAAVIQEVVDRPGWASGNAIVLLLTGGQSAMPAMYDGGASNAPKLDITYTDPPASSWTVGALPL